MDQWIQIGRLENLINETKMKRFNLFTTDNGSIRGWDLIPVNHDMWPNIGESSRYQDESVDFSA